MLNIFDLNNKDNIKISTLDNLTGCNNTSYFSESINFVMSIKKEHNENSKLFYKRILESNRDINIINESFSDYFNNIYRLIERFLKFIKAQFDKFLLYLNNLVKSNTHLKNNISKLKDFNSSHTFSIEGYKYKFNDNIPLVISAEEFKKDFYHIRTPNDIKTTYTVFNEKILDDYYDSFRSMILGYSNDYIQEKDFAKELLMVFREGSIHKDTITINPETLNDRITFYNNYSHIESSIRSLKKETEAQYNDILRFIKSSSNVKYGPNMVFLDIMKSNPNWENKNINKECYRYINLLIKAKASQIENISNIYTLTFGAKLDALRECFVQDSQILYKALQKI